MDFVYEQYMREWVRAMHPLQALAWSAAPLLQSFAHAGKADVPNPFDEHDFLEDQQQHATASLAVQLLLPVFRADAPLLPMVCSFPEWAKVWEKDCLASDEALCDFWQSWYHNALHLEPFIRRYYVPPGETGHTAYSDRPVRELFIHPEHPELSALMQQHFSHINSACNDWLKGLLGTDMMREWIKTLHPLEALALSVHDLVKAYAASAQPLEDPFNSYNFSHRGVNENKILNWLCNAFVASEDSMQPPGVCPPSPQAQLWKLTIAPNPTNTRAFWEYWERIAEHTGAHIRQWYNPETAQCKEPLSEWYTKHAFSYCHDEEAFSRTIRKRFADLNPACARWLEKTYPR